ncbi:hypothetical protein [Humidisolicoccus flavus]|uniref:hypothetical protein n=1 Tax=Humidisolicoccus flavus TaxID=3111414 RepID=UPI00324E7F1D
MMKQRKRDAAQAAADARFFIEIAKSPSRGVVLSTGEAWIGIDQQVGHGSADAFFALTPEQYAIGLANSYELRQYVGESWSGKHPDRLLFHPGGASWQPKRWSPAKARVIIPKFEGEIWRHVDALGEPLASEQAEISMQLAGGGASVVERDGVVERITLRLTGDGAYPRASALFAGLAAGSTREQVRAVLGEPVDGATDEYAIEADRARLKFVDDGLVSVELWRPPAPPLPRGDIATLFAALGADERGATFQAIVELAGEKHRRWAATPGMTRRLITFEGGIEVLIEDAQVMSVRVLLKASTHSGAYRFTEGLIAGLQEPFTRDSVRRALGVPAATRSTTDLHRFGAHDFVVEYDGDHDGAQAVSMTAQLRGTVFPNRFHRWRSGEFALFLDVLGRPEDHPLAVYVQSIPGARVEVRAGIVEAVEIGTSGYESERFAAFVDGIPAQPSRKELKFGAPHETGDHDDVRDFVLGWLHVHSADGTLVSTITLSRDAPEGLELHRWSFHRD